MVVPPESTTLAHILADVTVTLVDETNPGGANREDDSICPFVAESTREDVCHPQTDQEDTDNLESNSLAFGDVDLKHLTHDTYHPRSAESEFRCALSLSNENARPPQSQQIMSASSGKCDRKYLAAMVPRSMTLEKSSVSALSDSLRTRNRTQKPAQ